MDDQKPSVGSPTSSTGAPPPNLPVANPTPPKSLDLAKPATTPPIPPPLPPRITPPASATTPMGATKIPPPAPLSPIGSKPNVPGIDQKMPPGPAAGSITMPRSSIRTMDMDIKSAQTGKAPQSVELKPPVLPVEPPKPAVPTPVKPAPMAPPAGVKLGEAERRTVPLPGQNISKPPPPASVPKAPVLPPPIPAKPSGIAIPPSSGSKKMLMILIVVLVAVAAGAGFWWWKNQQNSEVAVSPTPTPSTSVSETPILPEESPTNSTLTSIYPGFFHLAVSPGDPNALTQFKFEATGLVNKSSVNKNTLVFVKEGAGDFYKFSNFLDRFSISFPINLASSIDDKDFGVILTKQTEFFDQSGKLIASPSAEMLLTPKIALAVRVVDSASAKSQLSSWEETMANDLREFFGLPEGSTTTFSDNTYQGVAIRYLNFPNPDKTIDYAIVTATNNNDYLIIANSREQIFSIIDKLLGF